MPIYEYICQKCNVRFSVFQNINSSKSNTSCPRCTSKDVKKVISACSSTSGVKSTSSSPSPSTSSGRRG